MNQSDPSILMGYINQSRKEKIKEKWTFISLLFDLRAFGGLANKELGPLSTSMFGDGSSLDGGPEAAIFNLLFKVVVTITLKEYTYTFITLSISDWVPKSIKVKKLVSMFEKNSFAF